jgi:hypothetical protein
MRAGQRTFPWFFACRTKKRTPDELRNWSFTKERIGQQLKDHYRACATEELPPRLLAVIKKLDEETEPSATQVQISRDPES